MPQFRLFLDSDHLLTGSSPSEAKFDLSRDICNVRKVHVKSCTFANTFSNVTSPANIIRVSDGPNSYYVIIPEGRYKAETFAPAVNTAMQAIINGYSFVALNTTKNALDWTLPAGMSISGLETTACGVLGLAKINYSGTFSTDYFLGHPMSIAFECNGLSDHTYTVTGTSSNLTSKPFLHVPIRSGFGTIETYIPPTPHVINCSKTNLSHLFFRIVDPNNGELIHSMRNWQLQIEIETSN